MATNEEFIIHIELPSGLEQTFYKDRQWGWQELSSKDNTFECTADQVLNHILPLLSENYNGNLKVRVEFLGCSCNGIGGTSTCYAHNPSLKQLKVRHVAG